jgi:RNA polymerase sigma factor (sigma-70 family)
LGPWGGQGIRVRALPYETTALFIEHRGSLVDYAARIVGSRAEAEDVVQEAWFRLNGIEDPDRIREPIAYLYRLVRNLAVDTQRSLRREVARSVPEGSALALADDSPSPERTAAERDELRVVLEALADLPERTRIAVRMNRIEGRKLREVAQHLDLSVTRTFNLIVEGIAHCDRWRANAEKK